MQLRPALRRRGGSAGSSIEYLKHLVDILHCDYLPAGALDADGVDTGAACNRSLGRITFYDSIAIVEKLSFGKSRPFQRILGGDAAAVQPFVNWLPGFSTSEMQRLLFASPAVRQFEQVFFAELDQRRGEVNTLQSKVAALSAEVEQLRASLHDRNLAP